MEKLHSTVAVVTGRVAESSLSKIRTIENSLFYCARCTKLYMSGTILPYKIFSAKIASFEFLKSFL